jgi:hypothetical protein
MRDSTPLYRLSDDDDIPSIGDTPMDKLWCAYVMPSPINGWVAGTGEGVYAGSSTSCW